MLHEHQRKIDRFLAMDRGDIQKKRVADLVQAVKSGELSIDDVTAFTNITPEQLAELIRS